MHPSTAWRLRKTSLGRVLSTLLALLISGIPNAAAATAFAAEVVSVEVVAGAPNGVVHIGAGASTTFPIQVSATGKLTKNFTSSSPAWVTIPTIYTLSATGAVTASGPSGPLSFWGLNDNVVTWGGAPTPYVVEATLNVMAGCPPATYTITVTPNITPAQPTGLPLENAVADTITVIVRDSTPPVTAAVVSGTLGSSGWYRSDVAVDLTSTDGPGGTGVAYTEYSLNAGATWTRGTSVAVSSDGVTTLHYRSADHAGNIETPAKQLSIKIDKTAPSLSFTNLHEGDCVREVAPAIDFSDTVSGIAAGTFAVTLNGDSYFGGVITEEGRHTLAATVTDEAGNTAACSVSFFIDRTNPTVTITNPADRGTYNSAQMFAFTAVDNCPGVVVTSDPSPGHIWTAEGPYTATASATDRAGNSGSDTVNFMIDTTAPQTRADLAGSLTASRWFVSPVTVSLNAADPISGGVASGVAKTLISVDGADLAPYVPDSPVTVTGEGDHTVSFYSVDAAGNAEPTDSVAFSIDTVAPTVGIALSGASGLRGWYTSSVLAELNGSDGTSGLDRIEYDLDGHGWVEYTGALTLVDGTHTLRARSFDIAGNVSSLAEEIVNVDTVAPAVDITLTGTAGLDGWYTSSVLAELNGSDGTSGLDRIEYDLGGDWAEYTGPLALTDGVHTLRARSFDIAGNIGGVVTRTVRVDTLAPVTTCTPDRDPDRNGWYTDAVTLTLGATDSGSGVAKTFYSFDGSTWDEYTAPLTIAGPGPTSIWYHSVDAAGNDGAPGDPCSVRLDLADPEPCFSGVSEGDWVYEATIGFEATDPTPGSGVDSVVAMLDGIAIPDGHTCSAEGEHTLVVTATDHAGRTKQARVTFTIDRTAPAITINNPADGGMYDSAQTFDFDVRDADPLARVTSDPANGHTWSAEGAHTASVEAEDRAGNASSKSIGFMIDTTAPETDAQVVTGTLGANGWWRSAVTIELTASDPVSGGVSSGVKETRYRLDGGPWTEGTSLDVAAEGSHRLEFCSVDRAGNIESAEAFEFAIDTSMPSAEIVLSGVPGASGSEWFVGDVTVAARVTDEVSGPAGWQYRLNDADPWTDTASLVLAHGVWDLQVRPIDIAGNIGGVVTRTVRVDTLAPVTTCTPDRDPNRNGWYTDAVTLTLGATDSGSGVAKTFYSFDGSTWDEYTAPLTIAGPGPTSIWYHSVDAAGNDEAPGDPCSVRLDLADPEPCFSGVSEGDWVYEATIGFEATDPTPGSGVDSVVAMLDGIAIPDGHTCSAEGEHTLVVTATDRAGRTKQARVTFTIDRTAPAITINNPADGGMYDSAQIFDFDVRDADPLARVTSDPANGHTWSAEGAHTASVEAEDRAGNASAAAISFLIDMKAPVSSAGVVTGTPGTNGWWKSAVTIELTASDPVSGGVSSGVAGTWYRLDGGPWTEGGSVLISTEGVHEVAYYSIDKAGNREAVRTCEVKVDLNAPVVNVASPTSTTYLYGASIVALFAASDSCSGLRAGMPVAALNGTSVSNPHTLVLTTAGANTFVARAIDEAGHETIVTTNFTVAFAPGTILPPGSLDHTWNAGRMMPIKFTVLAANGQPTDAAIAMVDVKLHNAAGVTPVASGQAHVVYEKGVPFYQFNAKTIKGQAGTLKVKIALNDGVTVMEKDMYLR